MSPFKAWITVLALGLVAQAGVRAAERVEDIPTRPGVTQRLLVQAPAEPKAAVILFAGGHGGLQVFPNGSMRWGDNNFVVRTRQQYAGLGLLTVVVDAPSDRQRMPFLGGFRQTAEHAADVRAVIAWVRALAKVPVWLVGTSRGTQSVAFVTTALAGADGPDGVVLTSSMLSDDQGRPLPAMPLDRIKVPVLVVHHAQDGCKHCAPADLPKLMDKLSGTPRKELLTFDGGRSQGDPCQALAYHGFNGLEAEVVQRIADWIVAGR